MVQIQFDPGKRDATLTYRGLYFDDAAEVFTGPVFEKVEERVVYGETRYVTIGLLRERMVVLVWTPRGAARHIISMRKANGREQARYAAGMV